MHEVREPAMKPISIKSARLYHSPYLQPLWVPKNPVNPVSPRPVTNRNSRNLLRNNQRAPGEYDGSILMSPTISKGFKFNPELTYDQRNKQNQVRRQKYDQQLAQKYTKAFACDPYKTSMTDTWQKVLIDHQKARYRNEMIEHQQRMIFSRQRSQRIGDEAERVHKYQMEINGVKEPTYVV